MNGSNGWTMSKQRNEQRLQLKLHGQVQGIGFRPFIYRLAGHFNFTGWVKNTGDGLRIEIQGQDPERFLEHLQSNLPARAIVNGIESREIPCITGEKDFQIKTSEEGLSQSLLPPDTAPCDECLRDLFDPQSRFYRYPFLSCTACGPRFSIAEQLPFDRCRSSMKDFPLCTACEQDYNHPENRRFHAQTIACASCGPSYEKELSQLASHIANGRLIGFKGPAGYQLIADAANDQSIERLRQFKHRPAKPFALMCLNSASVRLYAELSEKEEAELYQPARPIVLLNRRQEKLRQSINPDLCSITLKDTRSQGLSVEFSDVDRFKLREPRDAGEENDLNVMAVAPGLRQLGIMLPSTPAHYLIFHALAGHPEGTDWLDQALPICLLITSANDSGDAIIYADSQAKEKLGGGVDELFIHNRAIINGMDDSVIQMDAEAVMVRRARGYAPSPIPLPALIPPGLALGAELKSSFCFNRQQQAFVSQYIGDMKTASVIDFFEHALKNWQSFMPFQPEYIACDLHPDFYSSQLAGYFDVPVIKVQHHQAHLASVAAEHQLQAPALGLALDGYGMGPEQQAWGGELLLIDRHHFQALGQLKPLLLPGGDKAALSPWRMAVSLLFCMGKQQDITKRFGNMPHLQGLIEMMAKHINSPGSSSCGRYFDAASALAGLSLHSEYEGQAAMLLEALVEELRFFEENAYVENHQLNLFPLFERLLHLDNPKDIAEYFHGGLIQALSEWLIAESIAYDIRHILLSGGCFLNKVLRQGLTERLYKAGLQVYLPRQLPPNDGGISLGQLWVAGQKMKEGLCV